MPQENATKVRNSAELTARRDELHASAEAPSERPVLLKAQALRRLQVGPIDLMIERGTCVSITGRSGSGKSLLLRMMADLDPHDGDTFFDGQACSRMPAPAWRRKVTYVAAESGWWAEHVGAHFDANTDFATLLPAVGIPAEGAAWPVARLSTGERQRLALLRALTPTNQVLLLDEPTSGLDEASICLVEELLRQRLAGGTAILLVTHAPEQAARMASRHLELRDGRVVERTP